MPVTPDLFADFARAFLRHWPPSKPRPPILSHTEHSMKVQASFPPLASDVAGYKFTYTLPGADPVTVDAGADPIVLDSPIGEFACFFVAVGTNGRLSDPSDSAAISVPDDTKPDKPAAPTLTLLPNA